MAVKIRLARGGRKKVARYRIVVADSHCKRDGRFLETLGWYNPMATPKEFSIKVERVAYWLSQGAEPSNTIANLMEEDRVKEKIAALEKGLTPEEANISRKPESSKKKIHKSKKTSSK